MKSANDVVITGIGIVSCLGVGKDAHIAALSASAVAAPVVEAERFKPYPVHPMPEIDWSRRLPSVATSARWRTGSVSACFRQALRLTMRA